MDPLTCLCFLLLVLGRLFLLALPFLLEICLSSQWSPPFPLHALALIPLSLPRLTHLDSLPPHDLVLWTEGLVPFPFGKGSSGVLVNCSLCGTEATLSFSADQVCSSFSAEACAILHALAGHGSTNKSAIFPLFSSYLTLVLSSLLCPFLHLSSYLKLCGRSDRNCLLSPSTVLSNYNGSPNTHFFQGTTRLMSWPDGEHYSCPLQSLVVSLLLSLVSTLVFSWTGGVPRFPLRNLCYLVMLAVSFLVYAAMNTAFC